MKTYALAGIFVLAQVTPGFATTFYVALDTHSDQCRIMVTEPDGQIMRMLGSGPYASYTEAQAAMQAMPECSAAQKPPSSVPSHNGG
jgi:copper homeostasis protein CutC